MITEGSHSCKACARCVARWNCAAFGIGETALILSSVVQQSLRTFWRVRPNRFFVRRDSPARPIRHEQMTVDEFRNVVEQFMVPGNAVDVGLHEIGRASC